MYKILNKSNICIKVISYLTHFCQNIAIGFNNRAYNGHVGS